MLEKLLNQLELSPKEQAVYKLILEHGKITPASLGRLAGINRTTVYSVAQELKSKALIIEDLGDKTVCYIPARGDELEKIVTREKEKMRDKEASIRELQEFLKGVPGSKTYSVPKIRFVDEVDLEDYLYEAMPRWYESMCAHDSTWWGFQDHTFVEKFEKWIDWSWEQAPTGVNLNLLTNESDIEKKMADKAYRSQRHMRYCTNKEFTATQWVIGSSVIFIMTKQKPFYLVEVNDSVVAHNLRELFKGIWNKTL